MSILLPLLTAAPSVGKGRAAPCGAALCSWIARVEPGRCPVCDFAAANPSAVPAEGLRFAGRALAQHDVDQRWSAVVHGFVERALDVLRVLDEEALAAKGFHDLVVAGAVDQRVG